MPLTSAPYVPAQGGWRGITPARSRHLPLVPFTPSQPGLVGRLRFSSAPGFLSLSTLGGGWGLVSPEPALGSLGSAGNGDEAFRHPPHSSLLTSWFSWAMAAAHWPMEVEAGPLLERLPRGGAGGGPCLRRILPSARSLLCSSSVETAAWAARLTCVAPPRAP